MGENEKKKEKEKETGTENGNLCMYIHLLPTHLMRSTYMYIQTYKEWEEGGRKGKRGTRKENGCSLSSELSVWYFGIYDRYLLLIIE